MDIKTLSQKDLETVVELYIKERHLLCGLVSLEDFVKHNVKRCEFCKELFVTDMDDTMCEECIDYLEKENNHEEDDFDTGFFEANKEHYLYNI